MKRHVLLGLGLGCLLAWSLTQRASGRLDESWRLPAFSLDDQHRREVSLDTLRGRPFIASFLFTRCPTVCPRLTSHLRELQQSLDDIAFVSFSVDPEHDTVEALSEYAALWGDDPRWHLLRTDPATLQTLSDAFRVITRSDEGLHTSLLFLVVDDEVRGMYDSNDVRALERLRADVQRL